MLFSFIIFACVLSVIVIYMYGVPVFIIMCKYTWLFLSDSFTYVFSKLKILATKLSQIARGEQK